MIEIVSQLKKEIPHDVINLLHENCGSTLDGLEHRASFIQFCFSAITGVYAGIANVFSKMLMDSLILHQQFKNSLTLVQLIIVSVLLAFFLFFNVTCLNHTLALFSQLKVIPAYQSS